MKNKSLLSMEWKNEIEIIFKPSQQHDTHTDTEQNQQRRLDSSQNPKDVGAKLHSHHAIL
jgi:hypothetical protein